MYAPRTVDCSRGLFWRDKKLLYNIKQEFCNDCTREGVVMSVKDTNNIDVMCTHTMDSKIIPMKIRLKRIVLKSLS